MIDTYTKAVLTVIAIALLLLISQNYNKPVKAAFGDCGDTRNPCRIIICKAGTPEAVLGHCDN
jgi:hypothetical protein